MTNQTRGIITLAVFIIFVLTFMFAINMRAELVKTKSDFNKEMSFRLDMEQKVYNLSSEKIELITTLKNKDLEIQQLKNDLDSANQAFSYQEKKIAQIENDLKEMTLLKENLEENLKKALARERK